MISIQTLYQELRSFWRRQDGIAAVEAAYVMPIMLLLYLGSVELSFGIIADRKLTVATQTTADLVTQFQVIDDATIDSLYTAASIIMNPYESAPFGVDVTGITIAANLAATVTWTEHRGSGSPKHTLNQTITLPAGLLVPNSFIVLVQARYGYTAGTKYFMQSEVMLEDEFYMRPRIANTITFN